MNASTKLSKSRLKYRKSLEKIVPDHIGLPCDMPYGKMILFNQPPGSPYIVVYDKTIYMGYREAYLPKWLLTPECLDQRYKIREVEVNIEIDEKTEC